MNQYDEYNSCNCAEVVGDHYSSPQIECAQSALREVAARFPGPIENSLMESIEQADGRFDDLFDIVGEGQTAIEYAEPGDVIITMPLFPEEVPRVEVVSSPLGWGEFSESMSDRRHSHILLRPHGVESFEFGLQENPAALRLLGAAGAAGTVLGVGQQAVDLGQGVTQLQRDRLALTNERLDFAMRVGRIGSRIRRSLRGLSFQSQPASLQTPGYTPPTAETRASVWEFTLRCRYPDSTDAARYTFRINVQHDCFNIIEASVTNGTFDLGGFTVKSHMLTIGFDPQVRQFRAAFPGEMRFSVSGRWDPADLLGRIAEGISGAVIVRADGRVRLSGIGGGLVSATQPRRVGGSSPSACNQFYSSLRAAQAPAPVARSPGGSQVPTPTRRRIGSGGAVRRRSHPQPLPPDPPNGKHVFFRHGGARITSVHRTRVRNWWTSIGPNQQQAVTSGQARVVVNGHADPTGNDRQNIALSGQRATNVAELVRQLAGSRALIDQRGVGSQLALQNGVSGRDPNWRRATIRLATN